MAAYCRVSSDSDRLLHSLSAQVSYYNQLIQNNPDWEFAGIYSDEGISGTGIAKRKDFQRLIADVEAGHIDIVLTKSIQRFARNTVDLLNTVRHFKELGVEVRFEKERINSLSGDGELMMTILASFAQEEINSMSQNVKWGAQKRMESGKTQSKVRTFGYLWKGDVLVPIEPEASIVKEIYKNYLDGMTMAEIARDLNSRGITTVNNKPWRQGGVRFILVNITYTGNMLLGKNITVSPMSRNCKPNEGEQPKYYVENSHEALVSMETFEAVQKERDLRNKKLSFPKSRGKRPCLYGKLEDHTGRRCIRNTKMPADKDFTWNQDHAKGAKNINVLNSDLLELARQAAGLDVFDEQKCEEAIVKVVVFPDHLDFYLEDGRTETFPYVYRPKGWTEERKKHHLEQMNKIWQDPSKREARIQKLRETRRRKKECQSQEK